MALVCHRNEISPNSAFRGFWKNRVSGAEREYVNYDGRRELVEWSGLSAISASKRQFYGKLTRDWCADSAPWQMGKSPWNTNPHAPGARCDTTVPAEWQSRRLYSDFIQAV
jgi:hypothetical protein